MRVFIVAMVIAASLAAPAPAHSQVSVQVNIGQPPPVLVAQPVLVPVQASPVYYAPQGADVFFYDGRYYTVHNDQWFYATRVNTPWISVAIGKVPRAVLAVPVTYYRVAPGRGRGVHCPPGQAKKGRC